MEEKSWSGYGDRLWYSTDNGSTWKQLERSTTTWSFKVKEAPSGHMFWFGIADIERVVPELIMPSSIRIKFLSGGIEHEGDVNTTASLEQSGKRMSVHFNGTGELSGVA